MCNFLIVVSAENVVELVAGVLADAIPAVGVVGVVVVAVGLAAFTTGFRVAHNVCI